MGKGTWTSRSRQEIGPGYGPKKRGRPGRSEPGRKPKKLFIEKEPVRQYSKRRCLNERTNQTKKGGDLKEGIFRMGSKGTITRNDKGGGIGKFTIEREKNATFGRERRDKK